MLGRRSFNRNDTPLLGPRCTAHRARAAAIPSVHRDGSRERDRAARDHRVALGLANSPLASGYHHTLEIPLAVGIPPFTLALSIHEWVNDGLMAVFFFLVGLEMKREVLVGDLSTRRSATLPVAAALGGMLAPATDLLLLNRGGSGSRGWGVPMATDIAFALGVLALLGKRVPSGLRVFLAALAIVDDLGAVLVIAFFYSAALDWSAVGGATLMVALLALFNVLRGAALVRLRAGRRRALAVRAHVGRARDDRGGAARLHRTGAHAAVSAWSTRCAASSRSRSCRSSRSPTRASRSGGGAAAVRSPIAWGIVLGLVIGKPLGIMLASYAAVRAGAAELPGNAGWRHVHGVGWLGGIGFTMSLFIASLAFGEGALLDVAKLGVIAASASRGSQATRLLRFASPASSTRRR